MRIVTFKQTGRKPASWGCGYYTSTYSHNRTGGVYNDANGNRSTDGYHGMSECNPGAYTYVGGVGSGYVCPYTYYGYGCTRGDQWNTPIMGYVTRTHTVTYDKQSGLFSLGIGVPFAALNANLYSTQHV